MELSSWFICLGILKSTSYCISKYMYFYTTRNCTQFGLTCESTVKLSLQVVTFLLQKSTVGIKVTWTNCSYQFAIMLSCFKKTTMNKDIHIIYSYSFLKWQTEVLCNLHWHSGAWISCFTISVFFHRHQEVLHSLCVQGRGVQCHKNAVHLFTYSIYLLILTGNPFS